MDESSLILNIDSFEESIISIKNVETGVKNPHKMNFRSQKRGNVEETWKRKSLIYIRKTSFSTFPRFSKTFRLQKLSKDILRIIRGNVESPVV